MSKLIPAPIDNKNIMEDWLDDFMGDERINLSGKHIREYIFKTPLQAVLNIKWYFGGNTIAIEPVYLKGVVTWDEVVEYLNGFFLAGYEGMKTIGNYEQTTVLYSFYFET